MTDDELKDLVASLAVSQKETDNQLKETGRKLDKVAKMLGGISGVNGQLN